MRITLLTTGSRGDVQPFLALAVRLRLLGHSVCLAAPQPFQSMINQHGIDFSPLGGNAVEVQRREAERQRRANGSSLQFMLFRIHEKRRLADALNCEAFQASQGADAIIGRMSPYLGVFSIAECLKIPCFEVDLAPQVPTGVYPNTNFFHGLDWPGIYNRMTYLLVEQFNGLYFRAEINRFRKETLGLPPFPTASPAPYKRSLGLPVLNAFSQIVVPRPADWPDFVKTTGFWFLEDLNNWEPPQSLQDFIEAGSPPIYIGFGSMEDQHPRHLLQMVDTALEQSGQRGIWMAGNDGISPAGRISDRVYCLNQAPHDWLFPKMAAIVHHGGAGTTAASLRAGKPSIIIPYLYDQPFWGKRIAALGVGPKPVPKKQLTAEKLAGLIQTAVSDTPMQVRAQEIGEKIRSEDGVGVASEIIESGMKSRI